jgi:hypothetical protein
MKRLVLVLTLASFFTTCKKDDTITPLGGTPVAGNGIVDIFWTLDKPHSNVCWESDYLDWSVGKLTGRFNSFGFSPKFIFDEANLGNCRINAYVLISSIDSGEPIRDALGACIRSYMGQTYLDSMKTIVDPRSDTAWFRSTDVRRSGNGYVAVGTFSFNRYRAPSGFPDGTAISKPCNLYFTYNGTQDFDTDGDFINDKLRASFTGRFSFMRSEHMDTNSTIQYLPVPALVDLPGNGVAANNKTYGVWTTNVADRMDFTLNMQFYKNH